jgi:hypothetical protein
MNPFNNEKLTAEQLDKDCLCYMSISRQPVKSSRLFLGHLHETAAVQICRHFNKTNDCYRKVKVDKKLIAKLKTKYGKKRIFLHTEAGIHELKKRIDFYEFISIEEAYHQLMIELCDITIEAIKLVIPASDETSNIYITGGFSNNKLFLNLITEAFPDKLVYTSEIANASALGAALVVTGPEPSLNLGLTKCSS